MRTIDADYVLDALGIFSDREHGEPHFLNGIETAREIVEQAQTVGGWINVEDRLPEDERFVLVCNDDGKMMVAQYIAETDKWQYRYMAYDVDVWDDTEQGPIEWWMLLPEPPKEGDGR